MRETTTHTNVSVLFYYDGDQHYARPVRLMWRSQEFELGTVQFWHTTHHGGQLLHHYTVSDRKRQYVFHLALETENLTWQLESYEKLGAHAAQPFRTRLVGALS